MLRMNEYILHLMLTVLLSQQFSPYHNLPASIVVSAYLVKSSWICPVNHSPIKPTPHKIKQGKHYLKIRPYYVRRVIKCGL
jgi:hypothetical protein